MKTSTSLEHGIQLAGVSSRESAAMMKQAEFQGVDVSMCHNQDTPERTLLDEWMHIILEQNAALRAEGLEVAQCHLPYYPGHMRLPGDGTYQGFEDFLLPALLRGLEACGQIGCPTAVIHPFFDLASERQTIDGNLRLIEKMMPAMRKNGVKLALENVYAHDGKHYVDAFVTRPETILSILEKTDENWVGACIDTGHANIFRINIGQMARAYGNRLFALHVNGNARKDAHTIPYTMSRWCEQMDYHDFSAALKEIGYTGWYNLELNHGNLPASTAQAYLNLAGAVARALADLAD